MNHEISVEISVQIEIKPNTHAMKTRKGLLSIPARAESFLSHRPRSQHAVCCDPRDLDPKNLAEMARISLRSLLGVDPPAAQRLHRGRLLVSVTARDDAPEVLEIGGQVQREAVADDRPGQLDADRGDLLALRPDPGQTR